MFWRPVNCLQIREIRQNQLKKKKKTKQREKSDSQANYTVLSAHLNWIYSKAWKSIRSQMLGFANIN